jgi:transposase-like protein
VNDKASKDKEVIKELKKKNKELEKELDRKEKALAEMAALMVLK